MSRRSGQEGTIVKEGGWYRVRFRLDVPGQFERIHKSVKICSTSGPGLLTKSERERRKVEIVNSFGANSAEYFNQIAAIGQGRTFSEQAKEWLQQCKSRRRKPIKPATFRGWESYLDKWLNPLIGKLLLANVNNSALKSIVSNLSENGLSAKSIRNIVQVVVMVMHSAVNENGEEIFPRKWNYVFADLPVVCNQRSPMFTGENVTSIIAMAEEPVRTTCLLFAATGLRAGELFGLETKHFSGNTITVAQSVWEGRVQTPKTTNAYRQVDLHPTIGDWLRAFIGDRNEGFIFRTSTGTPFRQSNFLRSYFHPILDKLGIEKQGFHGFRRFRVTHLESSSVPNALVRYWTGHAGSSNGDVVKSTVTDKYVQMSKDARFRAEVAKQIGYGFELPEVEKTQGVPDVPESQETEETVST
jgi:integrase